MEPSLSMDVSLLLSSLITTTAGDTLGVWPDNTIYRMRLRRCGIKVPHPPESTHLGWSCDPTYRQAADNVLNVTHLSPFLSRINVRRLSLMSALRFSTMRSMQLSRTSERVWDVMFCQHMGHLSLRFLHSRMQCWQKLWAQFSVTDWRGQRST